jgi:hypothetical protein
MFNDFKLLNFLTTPNKFRKIKELFDRLDTATQELEVRLNSLERYINLADQATQGLQQRIKDIRDARIEKEKEVPPEPTNLPDLIVASIIPTLYSNYVDFTITIQNIGIKNSDSTTLNSVIPNLKNEDVPIPGIMSGDSFILHIQYSFDPDGTDELKTLISTVNPNHSLIESNYTNNTLNSSFNAKSTYSPDGNTYVIFHLHNPEGKEINSISGISGASITIEGVGTFSGASNLSTHAQRHLILSGVRNITVDFNGLTLTRTIEFKDNTTTEITFVFNRTEHILLYGINKTHTMTLDGSAYQIEYDSSVIPWGYQMIMQLSGIVSVSGYLDYLYTITPTTFHAENYMNFSGSGAGFYDASVLFLASSFHTRNDINYVIPSNTTFNKWYIQQNKYQSYPIFNIKDSSLASYSFIIETYGYSMRTLDSIKNYIALDTYLGTTDANSLVHHLTGSLSGGVVINDKKEINTTNAIDIKVSSVPYDLIGTAV